MLEFCISGWKGNVATLHTECNHTLPDIFCISRCFGNIYTRQGLVWKRDPILEILARYTIYLSRGMLPSILKSM